ncbi:DnaD domain protein [Desulfosporosinus sp. FKA]|uniref:DnaD domain-containing protein n=1 Tax=Desulfosporosinus sp. FKA TaxID=1969834 RepID=UPI000B49949B|nr:DnaD domain protein [Desulfosporosinus sp. FKA]
MAWIPSNQEIARHPKTKRLARLLGVSLPATVGHLHFLWWWALDFAQDGNLTEFDAFDLAAASEWDGDEKTFVAALISAGWIDGNPEDPDGQKYIHDWKEYTGKLIEKREEDAARKREDREKKRLQKTNHFETPTNTSSSSTEKNPLPNRSMSQENPLPLDESSCNGPKDDEGSSVGVPLDGKSVSLVRPTDVQRTSINNPESSNVTLTLTVPEYKPIIDDDVDDDARARTEKTETDLEIGNLAIEFARENWGRDLVPFEKVKIVQHCLDLARDGSCDPDGMLIKAIERSIDANKKLPYVQSIIEDWRVNGIIDHASLAKLDGDRKKSRGEDVKRRGNKERVHTRDTGQVSSSGVALKGEKYANFYL